MTDVFRVGVIAATHGLKGEVKVYPTTEDPRRFLDLEDVLLGDDEGDKPLLPVTVSGVRFFKHLVIVKFKEYNSINEVAPFKGQDLYVTRENAIPLEEGEFYIKDLYGMKVISDDGAELGELVDVLETGANDVYVVRKKGKKDLLIPAIPDCILNIDFESRVMKVFLLPGLLDL